MRIAVLDIGGTSIKSGLWTGERLEDVREQDTNARRGGAFVMERAEEILRSCAPFDAVGISTAGQVDFEQGMIRYANENIPGYTGMRVRERMEKAFGVPVAVDNDVNAAAAGEGHFGAAAGEENFLCITYGTGVGGAVVIGGEVYRGAAFSAGEFGGILIHPEQIRAGEPFSGCYEKYASTTALVARARQLDESLDNGRKIFARLQEAQVKAVVDSWIEEIVHGLISLIHIFNPSCIVLGGGVMAQPYIQEQVRLRAGERMIPSFRDVRICQASLGNQAGLFGAAWLAEERMKRKR